jgi:hypothetical protein
MAYTTIDKPTDYFNTILYTGNGSTQSITGVGFQPDWLWIKSRGATGNGRVHDVVRGVDKQLYTSLTNAEYTYSPNTGVTSFDSDGFSLGSDIGQNTNTETYASWNWLAGGTASSNTDGSITSSVSANTTAGFSIVSYTGNGSDNATVGHGLGSSIDFVIVKRRNTTSNWLVQGSKVGTGYGQYLELNGTGAITTASDNIKSVSSSTLTLGTNGSCNNSSDTYVAYCFAEKKGFSKFGSYTGNGNADGTFVYTGFKPAWIMLKRTTDGTNSWEIRDNKRQPFPDGNAKRLFADSNVAESSNTEAVEKLSNGFKIRSTGAGHNTSGKNYIYMAFAENPFVTSTGIPCTAR